MVKVFLLKKVMYSVAVQNLTAGIYIHIHTYIPIHIYIHEVLMCVSVY